VDNLVPSEPLRRSSNLARFLKRSQNLASRSTIRMAGWGI
jgi:hypothetical protein